jgi:hypothetical protein
MTSDTLKLGAPDRASIEPRGRARREASEQGMHSQDLALKPADISVEMSVCPACALFDDDPRWPDPALPPLEPSATHLRHGNGYPLTGVVRG